MKTNNKRKLNDWLWVELYRPQSVKDMILPTQYKNTFLDMVKKKKIPNLLLHSSSPGVGKTTLAKALCKELDADYKYINVSSESGIDTLRTQIQKFASTKSISGGQKIVIMDEFDGASKNLQQGLRAAIEEFKLCRFIFTCNYITQIITPLRSRLHEYDMNFTDKKIVNDLKPKVEKRIINILKHQEIQYETETVSKFVDLRYPDIRKMIGDCQKYSQIAGCIDTNIFDFEKLDEEFYDFVMTKKFTKARRYLIERNYNYTEMFTNLYKEFVPRLEGHLQPQVIIILADYQYKHSFAVDAELNFAACLLEIMNVI